ncbi:MAG TPA: gluconate 2-dehydrogenase subunit 3 family protein [Bacteroidota bacterium]|nr:gluconate 2-dehydrogenase subunit 3 family protein [Bacteroidota bacterium]
MNGQGRLTRRKFMKLAALGVGSISLAGGCAPASRSQWKFLSEDEAALLGAIAEQIIPTDEWPGGRDGGVVSFVDKQLMGPYRRFQQDYRKGLAAITDSCLKQYQKKFEAISWDEQTSFLKAMESGAMHEGVWAGGFSMHFFELLRSHSLQAYYGSPRHGGNPNYISYKMMGLGYPQIVGQNRYRT